MSKIAVGGELVQFCPFSHKKTFSAPERSVLKGRILSNMTLAKTWANGGQILPGAGFSSVPKTHSLAFTQFFRNLYFYSVSGFIRAIFEMAPKMPKTLVPESVTI